MDNVKDVLKAIKETSQIRGKVLKELGIKEVVADIAEDMYEFSYKKPDMESTSWTILHGKCVEKGQKKYLDWGYEFTQLQHFPASDKSWCRVRCKECGERLDEKAALAYEKERNKRLAKLRAEHEEYMEYRREWEKEQILLGKL